MQSLVNNDVILLIYIIDCISSASLQSLQSTDHLVINIVHLDYFQTCMSLCISITQLTGVYQISRTGVCVSVCIRSAGFI